MTGHHYSQWFIGDGMVDAAKALAIDTGQDVVYCNRDDFAVLCGGVHLSEFVVALAPDVMAQADPAVPPQFRRIRILPAIGSEKNMSRGLVWQPAGTPRKDGPR